MIARHPGLTPGKIKDLTPYQVQKIYRRQQGEQDASRVFGKTDAYTAFLRGLEWLGNTPEKAQEILQAELAKRNQVIK